MHITKERAKFTRNLNRIEIIVTYGCNMRCYNCEAMVRQAPSNEAMSVEQIQKFVDDSIKNEKKWESIRVLGGEPTVHKEIFEIFRLLEKYKKDYSPYTSIVLVTNGHGNFVEDKIAKLSEQFDIEVENSNKVSDEQLHFSTINQAPMDFDHLKDNDLTKGCWITSVCGITLSMHGFYPCSASAAIDRVFGYDIGRKEFPVESDLMNDLYENFCKMCGHYYHEMNNAVDFDVLNSNDVDKLEAFVEENQRKIEAQIAQKMSIDDSTSPTWTEGLKNWKTNKPTLSKY